MTPRGRLAWVLAVALSLGCSADESSSSDNRCDDSSDCPTGNECDAELGICTSERTSAPYQVVLQVTDVPREVSRLSRFTFPAFSLEGSLRRDLIVPVGVEVQGSVYDGADPEVPRSISAEVSFRPRAEETGFPVSAVVVQSRERPPDQEQLPNLRALLAPTRSYEVTVQPLGDASEQFPPVSSTFRVDGGNPRFELAYADLDTLSAVLVDEKLVPQARRWVRVRSNETNQVVSSTSILGPDGALTLHVLDGVLDDPLRYTLEVSLDPDNPWGETISVDGRRIDLASGVITIPRQPAKVTFNGLVEAGELSAVPLADLTFVSRFPVPKSNGDVRDRDWCRAKSLSPTPDLDEEAPFRCSATVTASAGEDGRFSVELLPGDYDVFIVPSREADQQRARTLASTAVIETQPANAPQQGQAYPLRRASLYRGSVLGLDGSPVRNAAIRLVALALTGTLGPVAAYNRSADAVTDEDGAFQLSVDTGYFDVVAQPPEDSGYPWVYVANKDILSDPMRDIEVSRFKLPAPVIVRGAVTSAGETLGGVRIDAYAIVKNILGAQRGVLIGTTSSDDRGNFVIKLPPNVLDGTEE